MSLHPWLAAALGGILIGFAAGGLYLLQGRIAGISGIAGRLLPPWTDEATPSRLGFVIGLVAAPLAWFAATGSPVVQTVSSNLPPMVAAGLLVGFGSTWGNGCTSGHGVCGLARLSPRSVMATAVFMAAAVLTVLVTRHLA